ncbi:MAG: prepilin-type N-terminal cleavage/methylation domain-containing protein [Candidatus Pacebacteria bacterium]|nr:prepilin-type N-terminal cleavage/methylation domain-containing protein [Candidatus Paceibacterota bacterium]
MHLHRRNPTSSSPSAFTLIELLVVIAIIAILAVVVVLTLNPAQLLAQSRDANRVSDMATLNTALGLYSTDTGGVGNMGTSTLVYTSFSDTSSTCGNLGLPALSASSTYNCTVNTSTRLTNALGWIPINFSNISAGSPLGSLPIDPTNSSSSGLFYTYSTKNGQFEVTAIPESQKQKASLGAKPIIPNYPDVIANGSSLGISPLFNTNGLVGYWPMDEGVGSTTQDQSGNGNAGTWNGTPVGTNSTYYAAGKVGSYAGYFNGNYVNVGSGAVFNDLNAITMSLWIAPTQSFSAGEVLSKRASWSTTGIPFELNISLGGLSSRIIGNTGCNSGASLVSASQWSLVTVTWDGSTVKEYVGANQVFSCALSGTVTNNAAPVTIGGLNGGGEYFQGPIDDVRIYNRALSAAEISALYNAGR